MGDLCAVAAVDSGGKQKGSCANLNVRSGKNLKRDHKLNWHNKYRDFTLN